jgi:hypothetical protein
MHAAPPLSPVGRAVSVRGDVMVKTQEPRASRRERLRTLAAQKVAQETGLFLVPEIVSYDDARGEIGFELLPLVEVGETLSDPNRRTEVVRRAAAMLAAIHARMEPAEEARKSSSHLSDAPGARSVPLHGDFGLLNILFVRATDRMVVIDWANADWIGFDADLGPPEIDLAVFLISLFHRRPFGLWRIPRRHKVAYHFLATYASAAPQGLDLGTLNAVLQSITPSFMRVTRRLKGGLRALGYRHGLFDLRVFLRRLPAEAFTGTPLPAGR